MAEKDDYLADRAKQAVADAIARLTGIPGADPAASASKSTGDPLFEAITCVRKSARGN